MKVVEVDGVVEGWSDKVLEGLRWWRWWRWRWWTDGGGGEAEGWWMARTDRLTVRRDRRRYTGRDSVPVGVGLMVQCRQKSAWSQILP